jgi:hypothetical protein
MWLSMTLGSLTFARAWGTKDAVTTRDTATRQDMRFFMVDLAGWQDVI